MVAVTSVLMVSGRSAKPAFVQRTHCRLLNILLSLIVSPLLASFEFVLPGGESQFDQRRTKRSSERGPAGSLRDKPSMKDGYIRDGTGRIIGRIDGNWLRDRNGKLVSRYDAWDNRTRDRNGKIMGSGDQRFTGIGPVWKWEIKPTIRFICSIGKTAACRKLGWSL